MGLLGTTQFYANVRDAAGTLLSNNVVTWTVANPALLGVSAIGLVTGLVLGNSVVEASVDGVTGSAPVTVSSTPPQATPGWPNLPAGYRPLADQSFSTAASLTKLWTVLWNDANLGAIVPDSSSPHSPGSVYQMRYPAGFAGGTAPSTVVYKLGRISHVFVGTWWKASAGWQGHESNVNKIQFLFPPDGNGDLYMTAYGPPAGPFELRVNLQFPGIESRGWLPPNVDPGRVTMGEWHRIEWLVELNTPGIANGVVRWWLDGRLVGDYRDVTFPNLKLDNFKLSPTFGGIGGAKAREDFVWYDHVFIAWR